MSRARLVCFTFVIKPDRKRAVALWHLGLDPGNSSEPSANFLGTFLMKEVGADAETEFSDEQTALLSARRMVVLTIRWLKQRSRHFWADASGQRLQMVGNQSSRSLSPAFIAWPGNGGDVRPGRST